MAQPDYKAMGESHGFFVCDGEYSPLTSDPLPRGERKIKERVFIGNKRRERSNEINEMKEVRKMEERKIMLNDSEIPRQWYNILSDMPGPHESPATPGDGPAASTRRPGARLSHEPHRAGDELGALDHDSRRGPGQVPPVPPHAAEARPQFREGPEVPRQDLLQGRKREPPRLPQTQHGHRAGLLQQGLRHQAALHGDRRGPVGQRARHGLPYVRPGMPGLHGPRELSTRSPTGA